MKKITNTRAWGMIVASHILVALATSLSGASAANSSPPVGSGLKADTRTVAFTNALNAAGFIVQPGSMETVDLLQQVNNQVLCSAQANNAGQFYKRLVVPPHPHHLDRPDAVFRLRPDEAIVYVGKTPPRGDYFSYVGFLFTRQYPDSVLLTGDFLVASVGDPLNHLWIKTENPGDPFAANTIIIVTADQGVFNRIQEIAGAAGFPESMVNSLVLSSKILHLGNSISSDTFQVLVRTANIADAVEEKKYFKDDHWAMVYRVTQREAEPLEPFRTPESRGRVWAKEESLVPGVTDGLERLKAAILAKTPFDQKADLESTRWWYDSQDVLNDDPDSPAYRQNVAGESSDTPYLRSAQNGAAANLILGKNDMVVVYGVNHAATGIATYSSFGVYGDWTLNGSPPAEGEPRFLYGCGVPIWNGVVGMTSHAFTGSAEQYIPGDRMAPYLYAVRVVREARRDVKDPYCVVVPEPKDSKLREPFYPDSIPLDKPLLIGYRAYLNRATRAGPAYEDIIWDRAIWFQLR